MVKKNLLVTIAPVKQAKQLFSSVYWNAGWRGDYMLLTSKDEVSEKDLKWFRNKGIHVKKCELIPNSEKSKAGKWPPIVFNKLYLFKPEFKKWKNIIYIEADMIVKASLEELTHIKGFAAVKGWNHLSKLFRSPLSTKIKKIDIQILKKLKKFLKLKETSFNSGVFVFSTDIIKKDTFSQLKKLLNDYIEITVAMDESILNLYFYKKWKSLPKVYNLDPYNLINFKNIKPSKVKGIIFHFCEIKPWNKKNYYYKEWADNLKKADLIDLKKIRLSKKWTTQEIKAYEFFLKKKHSKLKQRIRQTLKLIEEYLGVVGIFLKDKSPRLYFKLKKLEDRIRVK